MECDLFQALDQEPRWHLGQERGSTAEPCHGLQHQHGRCRPLRPTPQLLLLSDKVTQVVENAVFPHVGCGHPECVHPLPPLLPWTPRTSWTAQEGLLFSAWVQGGIVQTAGWHWGQWTTSTAHTSHTTATQGLHQWTPTRTHRGETQLQSVLPYRRRGEKVAC